MEKNYPYEISVSRFVGPDDKPWVCIRLNPEVSINTTIKIEMTCEEFGKLLSGLAGRPCSLTIDPMDFPA